MISIIVPAYNEANYLHLCLDSLVAQTTTQSFEVVLVDNHSTDDTVKVARQYHHQLDLRIVDQPIKGRGAARYLGFKEAKGNLLLSTDADTIVPQNWVDTLVSVLQSPHTAAVTGPCCIYDCAPHINRLHNLSQPLAMYLFRLIYGHYWLSGFSFGIHREIYLQSGGFLPHLNIQEDIDLSFKVSKLGIIRFIRHLPVIYSGRRYHQGLLRGALPYFTTFVSHHYQKNEQVVLSDVRAT